LTFPQIVYKNTYINKIGSQSKKKEILLLDSKIKISTHKLVYNGKKQYIISQQKDKIIKE